MTTSQIRLVDASYNAAKLELKLIIDIIKGMPECGNGIMLFDSVWTIREIKKLSSDNRHEVIAKADIQFLNDLNIDLKSFRGRELVCGLNIEDYKLVSSNDKVEYIKSIADLYPFKPISAFVKEHIQLSIALFPCKNAPRTGLSKLGGLPKAPETLSYPKDKEGKTTLFIGQIHLDEFNQWFESTRQLNGKGILYFFGSIEISSGNFHSFDEIFVRYCENTNDLVEIHLPDDIKEYGVFEEQEIIAVEEISLPPFESTFIEIAALTEEQLSLYEELELFMEDYNYCEPPEGCYFDSLKLMGYPHQVQQCILIETVFKNSRQGWYNPDASQREETVEMKRKAMSDALQWRHLFSFPTDSFRKMTHFKGEFNQYMDGIFNVMIKNSDLDNMNFNNTESIYQST